MGTCATKPACGTPPLSPAGSDRQVEKQVDRPEAGTTRRPAISAAAQAQANQASQLTKSGSGNGSSGSGEKTRSPSRFNSTPSPGGFLASFVRDNPSTAKIHDVYSFNEKKIGEGSFGSVLKAKHKSTHAVRAVKCIAKAKLKSVAKFDREVEIMKMMDHPNIIKLFETFQDAEKVYLAMELCEGGELFDKILDSFRLTEKETAVVVQQILRATHYMHEKQICHRDLKPENFMFSTKEAIGTSTLKVIDFGLSCRFTPGGHMFTRAGTPYYVSPQVLAGRYDHLCDIWSVGAITYLLLCGYPPFHARTDREVLQKVQKGNYSLDGNEWARISADAKGLIRNLLRFNAKERYSAEQALSHDWIVGTAPRANEAAVLQNNETLLDNLRSFRVQNRLKKATLQIIVGQLDENQIKGLREIFTALDANQDGLLTLQELQDGLDRAGLDKSTLELESIMAAIDTNASGMIDYTEFLAAALDKKRHVDERMCWTAFSVFDSDGDGKITMDELQEALGTSELEEDGNNIDSIARVMLDADRDGDGAIDFKEFVDMMKEKTSRNSPDRYTGYGARQSQI